MILKKADWLPFYRAAVRRRRIFGIRSGIGQFFTGLGIGCCLILVSIAVKIWFIEVDAKFMAEMLAQIAKIAGNVSKAM